MNNKGVTLVELLVACAAATIIVLAVGSFFVAIARLQDTRDGQVYLQRQGTFIIEEMARQVRPATALAIATCSGVANALQVVNASGTYCFYQSTTSPYPILEDRTIGGATNTMNLLTGPPVTIQASRTSGGASTFTATLWTQFAGTQPVTCGASGSACKATVTFELGACLRGTAAQVNDCNFMTFSTDLTRRN
jgi:Tfp pilus assembly protein PilW